MILARRFLENVRKAGMANSIKLEEWRHLPRGQFDGWTYHAKGNPLPPIPPSKPTSPLFRCNFLGPMFLGIWITPPGKTNPMITLIGSSNFTRRSEQLDLESTCVIITRDPQLQTSLSNEVQNLRKYTTETDIDKLNAILKEGGWRRGMAVRAWVACVGGML
jgi:CDP-diacylglycerol---glycerol-3-phosphate 3-phosphatidyltransferase